VNDHAQHHQLLLVRHAKSSWKDDSLHDIDRPLNKRGLRDAPEMGRRLADRNLNPQLIVTSPAARTLATAQAIAAQLNEPPQNIVIEDCLYGATSDDVLNVIRQFDDSIHTAMVVFHNPTITDLANRYADPFIDNVPTCGIITLQLPTNSWSQAGDGMQLLHFDYPNRLP
jgi:phosphohistidine phosphatase